MRGPATQKSLRCCHHCNGRRENNRDGQGWRALSHYSMRPRVKRARVRRPRSVSASRLTASHAGFFVLSSFDGFRPQRAAGGRERKSPGRGRSGALQCRSPTSLGRCCSLEVTKSAGPSKCSRRNSHSQCARARLALAGASATRSRMAKILSSKSEIVRRRATSPYFRRIWA
jgi:hypothetical protein